MSQVQTIKSAIQGRVNTGIVENQAGAREANHFTALCGASWPDLQNDIFGRNTPQVTLDMRGGGAECNAYMPYGQSLEDHITRENLERPYIQIMPEGARGAADLMGKGRDVMPQDLYGAGLRGNFVRQGRPGLRLAQPPRTSAYPPIQRRNMQNVMPTTHDMTDNYNYRG